MNKARQNIHTDKKKTKITPVDFRLPADYVKPAGISFTLDH